MKNNNSIKGFLKGFVYAFRGIRLMFKERNMRVHLSIGLNVLVLSPFLGITRLEYALLLLTVALVLSLEGVNSAVERLCDKVTMENDEKIKNVKDIAAGAVLIAAVFSVIIGLCVLLRPKEILSLFTAIFTNPLYACGFIISEGLLTAFVISAKKHETS